VPVVAGEIASEAIMDVFLGFRIPAKK